MKNEKKKSLLEGTVLEDAFVISFNSGLKDVVRVTGFSTETGKHVYQSILSGAMFADSGEKQNIEWCANHRVFLQPVTTNESITSYLTAEEMIKALNNELTQEDLVNVVTRAVIPSEEQNRSR